MPRTSTLLAVFLAAGSVSSVAHAQSWASPVSGAWFTAGNWSPMVVPSGAGATGTLGLSGAYTVTTTSNTLLGLNITNPGAVLAISPGNSLSLAGSAPGVVNTLNGTVLVNATGAYSGTNLHLGTSAVSFAGSGVVRLNASPSDSGTTANTGAVLASGGSLTMGAGTSLAGFGILNGVPSTNYGTFVADVAGRPLRIEGQTHQNNGLYTASNTGVLVVSGAVINQGAGASIAPGADSSVQLSSTSVHGGQIISTATGRVQLVSGSSTVGNVAISGGVDISPSTITYADGAWLLNGGATVLVNASGAYAGTTLRAAAPSIAVNGNGTVRLNASPSDGATTANTAALMGTAAGDSFVFAPGVTVAGFGIVNGVPTVNNGVFNADMNGRLLRVQGASHQNNNLYTATGGGGLYVSDTVVTQGPGAAISAVGAGDNPSVAVLNNTTVTGGSLMSNGAARVNVEAGSYAALSGVTLIGQIDQRQSSIVYVDAPGITLSPGSMLLVNSPGAYAGTSLRTGEAVTIGGSGTIRLNASTSDGGTTANTAALLEDGGPAGGSFSFGPSVTLAGFGIVSGLPTTNNGLFVADIAGRLLRLEGSTHQNNNLYTSSNGGTMLLNGTTVNQSPTARTLAGDGSFVVLSSSTVNGGTIGSPAGGTGDTSSSGTTVAVNGVTVSRQFTVDHGGVLATTGLTLSNNALVTVNTAGAYSGTRMRADGAPSAIGGTGTVHLNASTSDSAATAGTADLARNGGVAGSGFTFGAGVTVDGFGRISDCPTTNNGVVAANTSGRPLRIEGNLHQNNNIYRASGGGVLDLAGSTITQSSGGQVRAEDASTVNLNGCTLSGGTMNAAGSGSFSVVTSSSLSGLTNNAPLLLPAGRVLDLTGPLSNNGVITVNPSGVYSGTALRAGGVSTALNGSGSVVLNVSISDGATTAGTADLGASAAGNSWVFGAGQTLAGRGRITAPVTMSGVVSPGSTAGATSIIRNDSNLTFTGSGRLHIDVASVAAYDSLVNAGTVNLGGWLEVAAAQDFAAGTTFDVITGGTYNGEFAAVISSGLAAPKRFGARYDNAGRVRVTVLCGPADIAGQGADGNGDGVLNNNDFIVYIDRFFNNDPRADVGAQGGVPGNDGVFDNNDFIVFIDLFFAGCF